MNSNKFMLIIMICFGIVMLGVFVSLTYYGIKDIYDTDKDIQLCNDKGMVYGGTAGYNNFICQEIGINNQVINEVIFYNG